MKKILVDSDAILALLCREDPQHLSAVNTLRKMQKQHALPVLTNYLLAETHALLTAWLGTDAARIWLRGNIWPIEKAGEQDEKRALEILLSGRGRDCTLTDAVSIALMERLGIQRVFSFSNCFTRFGFKHAQADCREGEAFSGVG